MEEHKGPTQDFHPPVLTSGLWLQPVLSYEGTSWELALKGRHGPTGSWPLLSLLLFRLWSRASWYVWDPDP